jgi:hypothetical protein
MIVVGTKADKLSRNKLSAQVAKNKRQLAELGVTMMLPFSAVTGQGKPELLDAISAFL